MNTLLALGIGLLTLFGVALIVALALVVTPMPVIDREIDVFGLANDARSDGDKPESGPSSNAAGPTDSAQDLKWFRARDGSSLPYRLYESETEVILMFIHGSSYHGGGYHDLAVAITDSGAARVVLPNLRGHYMSGQRRGDVDYIGQLEDDLADLIGELRSQGDQGPIYLGGHSSGGGLAIRFGSGLQGDLVKGLVLIAPVIPTSKSVRGGDAGGWAVVNQRRLFGLIALGVLGIHGLDALPIIQFNKPTTLWDGTETLAYSYRLNTAYHPRQPFERDLEKLPERVLVLIGEQDEAIDAQLLRLLFTQYVPQATFKIAPGLSHFDSFQEAAAHQVIATWLQER